jgi:hypothetical protein
MNDCKQKRDASRRPFFNLNSVSKIVVEESGDHSPSITC